MSHTRRKPTKPTPQAALEPLRRQRRQYTLRSAPGGHPDAVKTYPELNLECIRQRLEKQYRIWLLCRHLDEKGYGWCYTERIRDYCESEHLFSDRTIRRTVCAESRFWRRYRGRLYYVGVEKLAALLSVELRQHPVLIPLVDFVSLRAFRSSLLASFFAEKPKIIAQSTLSGLCGRSVRSVQRYLESDLVNKSANAMYSLRDPAQPLTPELAESGYHRTVVDSNRVLVKRLPNTYSSIAEQTPRGQISKRFGGSSARARSSYTRRFYQKPRGVVRAVESLSPGDIVVAYIPGARTLRGAHLWQGYAYVPGYDEIAIC